MTALRTPLYDLHVALGARMAPFAGYDMPIQYSGVLAEHHWTRAHAGLFDVSHMGQARLTGADPFKSFEKLVCGDYQGLKLGRQRYSLLLAEDGGILDDLMASRPDDQGLFLVVNAACKTDDFAHIERALAGEVTLTRLEDRALLALQGPEAAAVLAQFAPEVADMAFMDCRPLILLGEAVIVSRSGYTGEDGYEISIPSHRAADLWNALTGDERVKPIGLGARDSLRLEAGLPLYGHDASAETSPVAAGLTFALSKKRLAARDFNGAERMAAELDGKISAVRLGLKAAGGAPAREGADVADSTGAIIGKVSSGGPSPSLGGNIAMAYLPPRFAEAGTEVQVIVRGKSLPYVVTPMPFRAPRFFRKV